MRIIIRVIALIAATVALAGCAVGNVKHDSEATKHATLHFIGVPTVLGAVGSSTPVSVSYSLTAAHVLKVMPHLDVVSVHPYCDVALIREKNAPGDVLMRGSHTVGQPVTLYGYSARTALPMSGKGIVKRSTRFKGTDGRHSCPVITTSAGGMQGMSGGAAVQHGDLVGITVAINVNTDETVVVPLTSINVWLNEVLP